MRRATRPPLLLLAAWLLAACTGGDAREPVRRADGDAGLAPSAPAAPAPGMDSARLARILARADSLPRLRSLLIARHGDLYLEQYFRGAGRDRRANIKSASKSVLSALVGIAIAEGGLQGTEQPIAPFFPRYLDAGSDPLKREITIGHLLSMQSGLEPTSFGNYGRWVSSRDWVGYVLARPMVDRPGGRMLYSTGSTHLLSALLTRAMGMSTYAYARSRLAEPLEIELRPWPTDPQGIYFGGNDMLLTPREMLRFGELYRNDGVYRGRQVVPAAWIRESWKQRTTSPYNGHGYGYGWWMREMAGHMVYFAWGYGGQYIFVVPELELTVVTTSVSDVAREGDHLRAVHALLREEIIPAAAQGGPG